MHRWIAEGGFSTGDMDIIPYEEKYIALAQIEDLRGDISQHPDLVVVHPESASDARDTADWARVQLQHTHESVHPSLFDFELGLINLDTVS